MPTDPNSLGSVTSKDVWAIAQAVASAQGGGGGGVGGSGTITYETRSSNTILGTADTAKYILITAQITQTLTAAATLGAGWWCVLKNRTTDGTSVLTVDPNGSETIDGLTTIKMYSGEARILICDGSGFGSVMLNGGFAKFTSTGQFTAPYGLSYVSYDLIGPGGNGGNGMASGAGTARPGGSGGGGGARSQGTIPASEFTPGTNYQMTLSASTTTFMSCQAYKGGNGVNADGTAYTGGSGGGVGEFGLVGDVTAQAGGGHATPGANPIVGQGGCGADSQLNGIGLGADWGGGSGASPTANGGSPAGTLKGGTSCRGGGGGGAGGGVNTSNVAVAGGDGGNSGFYTDTGGNGGGAGGANTGVAGAAGADATGTGNSGKGGGGGGANAAGAGGNGGAGGVPGGGGGGGGSGTTSGGTGGTGGRGEGRVYYS